MNNYFISYSRRDKEFVEKLVASFKTLNRDVWVDWEDIPLTADWLQEIQQGIEGADDFIFIISPDSIASEVCSQELAHALQLNKRLVPVLYRQVENYREIHQSLASHNWIMFNKPDAFDTSFEALVKALDTDLDHTRSHTRILQRAIEWNRKSRNPSLLLRGQDLIEAEQWLSASANKVPQATQEQTEYIFASRRRATSSQRILTGALMLGFIASIVLTIFAIDSRNQAQDAAEVARKAKDQAQSLLLADNARQLGTRDPATSIVLALAANSSGGLPPAQAQRTLADLAYAPGIKSVFPGFNNWVTDVSFSSNRKMVLAGAYDGSVSVWDIEKTDAPVFYNNELALPVKSIAFSDNDSIFAAGYLDGSIRVWQINDLDSELQASNIEFKYTLGGLRLGTGHSGTISALIFLPDNRHLISGGSDDQIIIWDINTGQPVRTLRGHADDVTSLAISPDGKLLYSGSGATDRRIIVWNIDMTTIPERNVVTQFARHGKAILSIAISPDGRYGVSSSEDNDLVIWNTADGSVVNNLGDTFGDFSITAPISGVGFTPDSAYVVTTSRDGKVVVWDIVEDKGVIVLGNGIEPLTSIAVSSDGRSVLTGTNQGGDSRVLLWDIDNGAVLQYLVGHQSGVNAVAFNPDGKTVVTGSDDTFIMMWDAATYDILGTLTGHEGVVQSLAFNSDGSLLASGGADSNLILWDMATMSEQKRLSLGDLADEGVDPRINALVFLPDNKHVIAGLDDRRLVMWDIETGEIVREYVGHARRVLSLEVNPSDPTMIASGSADGEIIIWNVDTGAITLRLKIETSEEKANSGILALAFHPTNNQLLSGTAIGRILLWDVVTGKELRRFNNESTPVYSLDISPDGHYVLSGDGNNTVKLWDLASGEAIRSFPNTHSGKISSVAFSPDGNMAVSGARESSDQLNVESGLPPDDVAVLWRMPSLAGLIQWTQENRYTREFSCEDQVFYHIVQDCSEAS